MSNYYGSNKNHYYQSDSSSSPSCLGGRRRTLNNTAYPSPPTPISSSTNKPPPHFSTPRNQRFVIDNNNNNNNCFSDIDEWLEHANKFCKSFNHHHHHHAEPEEPEQEDLRISAVGLTNLGQRRLYNMVLPSVREESPLHSQERTTLIMHRLDPYVDDEFLNEIRRKKLEAEDARNKAKHLQLMHILRRKEDAINDWEFKQTTKAMDHMDKIQNELERKQIIASVKTQKKIYSVREKAEKQKLKLRRSTMKKFQQLRASEADTYNPSHSHTSCPLL